MNRPLVDRLLPMPRDSGFRQQGYIIWCGSVVKADGRYHMFASRWPSSTKFPHGYRDHSQIVRATSNTPAGPYRFVEVVLSGRGNEHWDGQMCHNPKIIQVGSRYVLYYIGAGGSGALRKTGYAWAHSVEGPWQRIDQPLPLGEDAVNPAPYVHGDGSVLMAFRDLDLCMHIAKAPSFDGSYQVVARNVFPPGPLEDPDLFFCDGQYHMVMEDNEGVLTGAVRHGGHLLSNDGVHWHKHDPVKADTHTTEYEDGASFTADRRERPELFNANAEVRGNGAPTHLVTGVWFEGEAWCAVQPIAPS